MIECPECHAVLRPNAKRCACGWEQADARKSSSLPGDPFHFHCAHEDRGQRCAEPGALASSTTGGGPWYCHEHFPPFRAWRAGKRAGPTEAFRTVRQQMRHVAELLPEDAESLAERAAIENESEIA